MVSESTPFTKDYDEVRTGEDSSLDLQGASENEFRVRTHKKQRRSWFKDIALLLSILTNALLAAAVWWAFDTRSLPANGTLGDHPVNPLVPGVEEEQTVAMHWAFQYTAETVADMDEVDRNWNAIDASHGLVSIEHDIAAQHGLPRAMDDPRTSSKGLYILEGYHSLHCLVVIRHTMFQLARGEELDVPFGHSTHCVGALLQNILCNADTTLMYQKQGVGPGDGQKRTCRNWGAMRDWAKENSACMSTNASGIADLDLANCDKIRAGDGVILQG